MSSVEGGSQFHEPNGSELKVATSITTQHSHDSKLLPIRNNQAHSFPWQSIRIAFYCGPSLALSQIQVNIPRFLDCMYNCTCKNNNV